jgi:hypothetical protein
LSFVRSPITLINIYASSDSKPDRDKLFDFLRTLDRPSGIVLLGGDFNCVLDRELDRSRIPTTATETDSLQPLLDEWGLDDAATGAMLSVDTDADRLRFYKEQYTFRYRHHGSDLASSRLDRWYLPTTSLTRLYSLHTELPVGKSDHDAVRIVLIETRPPRRHRPRRGRRAIRYPLPDDSAPMVRSQAARLLDTFSSDIDRGSPAELAEAWDALKTCIRVDTLTALATQRKKIRNAYRQRRKRLHAWLRSAQAAPGLLAATVDSITEGIDQLALDRHERWQRARDALVDLAASRALRQRQRTFAQYAGNGHDAARAFYRRINSKFMRRPQARLPSDPARHGDPAERMAADWRPITQQRPPVPALQDASSSDCPCHGHESAPIRSSSPSPPPKSKRRSGPAPAAKLVA